MPVAPALFQIAEALGEVIGRRLVAQWAAEGRLGATTARAPVARARQPARPAQKAQNTQVKISAPRQPRAQRVRVKESLAGLEPGMTVDFRTRKAEGVGKIESIDETASEVSVVDLRTREVHKCRPSEVQVRTARALPPQKRRRAEAHVAAPGSSPVQSAQAATQEASMTEPDATSGTLIAAPEAPPPSNLVPLDVPAHEPERAPVAPSPVELAIAEASARLRRNG